MKPKDYSNGEITVRWDAGKCYHSANCVKGLPKVFDPKRKPWIKLDEANSQQIVDVVNTCPSGALNIVGQNAAEAGEATEISLVSNGPYRIKGNFIVRDAEGNVLETGNAAALCACGQSSKKPFCDGTHKSLPGFQRP